MKLHLPKMLLGAVLAAVCFTPALATNGWHADNYGTYYIDNEIPQSIDATGQTYTSFVIWSDTGSADNKPTNTTITEMKLKAGDTAKVETGTWGNSRLFDAITFADINVAEGGSATLNVNGDNKVVINSISSGRINSTIAEGGTLAVASADALGKMHAVTVKENGLLDLTGLDNNVIISSDNSTDEFSAFNDNSSITTEAGGYIRLAFNHTTSSELKLINDITLKKNIEAQGALVIHGSAQGRSFIIAEGTALRATSQTGNDGLKGLEAINQGIISIQGGSVEASEITLGHTEAGSGGYWGKLEMTAGSLSSGTIYLRNNHTNTISVTGGTLEFTNSAALNRGNNTATSIRIVGTSADAMVTLKATQTDWTLDGAGLSNNPTVGNVTIDAGNTHNITLQNVTLTGSIVNNGELTLGKGITVAEEDTATVTGSKVTISTTLASTGVLQLNTDAIYLDPTLQGYVSTGGTSGYSLTGTGVDEGNSSNGFKITSGGTYYLSQNTNVTTTASTAYVNDEQGFALKSDESGLWFVASDAVRSAEYYIGSGEITIDSTVQALAKSYVLNGGTLKLTEGRISGSNIEIAQLGGGIVLSDTASVTSLTGGVDTTLIGGITGSGTIEIECADNWNTVIGTNANFNGTVYIKSGKFTYDSTGMGNTLKMASNVHMQVNGGGTLFNGIELESGNHQVHINGGNTFTIATTISGDGVFDKQGPSGSILITEGAQIAHYKNSAGTTNINGGTITNLTTADGTANISGGTVQTLGISGGTTNITGGTVQTIDFSSGGNLNFKLSQGAESANITVDSIKSTSANNYQRNMTVDSGVVVNATSINNGWGIGTFRVDGTLNISDNIELATGNNNSTENNIITGTGTINTKKLTIGNCGTYNLSGVTMNIGSGGIASTNWWSPTLNLGALTIGASDDWESDNDRITTNMVAEEGTSTVINTNNHTINLKGGMTGSGAMTKTGSGILKVDGDVSNYTGAIEVNGGKLQFTKTDGSVTVSSLSLNGGLLDVTGSLTLTKLTIDLDAYSTEQLTHTLISAGSFTYDGDLSSYDNVTVGTYTTKVTQSDTGLTLTFSEIVAPGGDSLTTTVTGFESYTDGMLTLKVDGTLAEGMAVVIEGFGSGVLDSILQNVKTGTMVGITLTDGTTSIVGTAEQNVGFQGAEGIYYGENVDGAWQYNVSYIPEPTTATLSLLALCGLAARRRRASR